MKKWNDAEERDLFESAVEEITGITPWIDEGEEDYCLDGHSNMWELWKIARKEKEGSMSDSDDKSDWKAPNWDDKSRVHNWKNYISLEMKSMWETFTDDQKQAIASNAEDMASKEEWD